MADRAQQINLWPGIGAAAGVAALILGTLGVVVWAAPDAGRLGAGDWAAIRFTVVQALVSASLSVILAVPVARALARRVFWGREALITLLGAPFLLPVIVAVMGLLAVFGRAGIVAKALAFAGLPPLSIYGFHGVVLAHVFFNVPLATRIILQGWASIPAERFRLAAHLGFGPREVFRVLEWPMLMRVAPGAFAIIFAICLSSFAVALTLGGGPRATTVELAIYQAFRFDFDLARAAMLASVQLGLAGCAAFVALGLSQGSNVFGQGLDRAVLRWDVRGKWGLDAVVIGLAALFLLVPMGAVLARGIVAVPALPSSVWQAAGVSVAVAVCSALLCLCMALAIAVASVRLRWLESAGLLAVASSPLVIGTGLFIVIFPFAAPDDWALVVTGSVNAVMALPFALRVLVPAVQDAYCSYGRLAMSLNLGAWGMLRMVVLPRARGAIGFALGLAAALSMGDLGVVALFAGAEQATLPLQVYRLMGAYKMDAAAGAAVLLAGLSFAMFWICDRWGLDDA